MGDGLVIASGVQGGHAPAPGEETFLIALASAALVLACVLIGIYLRRQYRRPRLVADEWQAQGVMGELCPHGWQAHITFYGWAAPVPADAPPSPAPMVELEWKQFDDAAGRIAVARRLWAPTIGEALQKMVEDRQTDITLEQIEQTAAAEQDLWRSD